MVHGTRDLTTWHRYWAYIERSNQPYQPTRGQNVRSQARERIDACVSIHVVQPIRRRNVNACTFSVVRLQLRLPRGVRAKPYSSSSQELFGLLSSCVRVLHQLRIRIIAPRLGLRCLGQAGQEKGSRNAGLRSVRLIASSIGHVLPDFWPPILLPLFQQRSTRADTGFGQSVLLEQGFHY
jgi:hypothetical protein